MRRGKIVYDGKREEMEKEKERIKKIYMGDEDEI